MMKLGNNLIKKIQKTKIKKLIIFLFLIFFPLVMQAYEQPYGMNATDESLQDFKFNCEEKQMLIEIFLNNSNRDQVKRTRAYKEVLEDLQELKKKMENQGYNVENIAYKINNFNKKISYLSETFSDYEIYLSNAQEVACTSSKNFKEELKKARGNLQLAVNQNKETLSFLEDIERTIEKAFAN